MCSHDLTGPTPSSGSSTPIIQTNNLAKQNASTSSSAATTTNYQNVLPSSDNTADHMITKNVIMDISSDRKGITRQGADAMDLTRKGPPPVPTRASSTALTDEQQKQQQSSVIADPPDGSHDIPAAVTKVPPKVAKKPKANKRPTQASTGNPKSLSFQVNKMTC